jgi:hypothetical protein
VIPTGRPALQIYGDEAGSLGQVWVRTVRFGLMPAKGATVQRRNDKLPPEKCAETAETAGRRINSCWFMVDALWLSVPFYRPVLFMKTYPTYPQPCMEQALWQSRGF